MYPDPGGWKFGSALTRLPNTKDWERLAKELEDRLEGPLDDLDLELDQVEFTVEMEAPKVNVYYSTRPRGLRGRRPQLEPMVVHGVALMINQAQKEILGDLLAPTA